MKESFRRRTQLDVAKKVPRSFATVPTQHFGTRLGSLLKDFGG